MRALLAVVASLLFVILAAIAGAEPASAAKRQATINERAKIFDGASAKLRLGNAQLLNFAPATFPGLSFRCAIHSILLAAHTEGDNATGVAHQRALCDVERPLIAHIGARDSSNVGT